MISRRSVAFAGWAVAAAPVLAGGFVCGPAVLDVTNLAKNETQAVESAKKLTAMLEAIRKQAEQFSIQKAQLQGSTTSATAQGLNAAEIQAVDQLKAAVSQLYGSSSQLSASFQRRMNDARTAGLSWPQYVQREQERINRNADNAVRVAAQERRILERVQRDHQYAQELAARVPSSAGIHEAAQDMNRAMNRLISQHAEFAMVLAPMAQANGVMVDAAVQKQELQQQRLKHTQEMVRTHRAARQSEQRALDSLRSAQ